MSAKNELQEYFQKRQLLVPKYVTIRGGGLAHQPEFISSMNVFDKTFTSGIFNSKRKAEQNVAELVLEELFPRQSSQKPVTTVCVNDKVCVKNKVVVNDKVVLIDLENCPQIMHVPGARMIGFMSNCCSMYSQQERYTAAGIELQIVYSAVKDAADTYLAFYLAKLLYEEGVKLPVYIVSKDHYAGALVDICRGTHNVVHVSRLCDIP